MSSRTLSDLSALIEHATSLVAEVSRDRANLTKSQTQLEHLLSRHARDGLKASLATIEICTKGPTCQTRGSKGLVTSAKRAVAALPPDQSKGVAISEVGCLRRCSQGPNVKCGDLIYSNMTPAKIPAMVQSHAADNRISIALLDGNEYLGDTLKYEEKRVLFLLSHEKLAYAGRKLAGEIARASRLLADTPRGPQRVLTQLAIMRAIKLATEISAQVDESARVIASAVDLSEFVDRACNRAMADFKQNK